MPMLFRHHDFFCDNIAVNDHQISLMLTRCNLLFNTWETCEFATSSKPARSGGLCRTNGSNEFFQLLQPLVERQSKFLLSRGLVDPGIPRKDHQVVIRKLSSNTPFIATWIPCGPVTDTLSSPSMLQSNPALRKTSTGSRLRFLFKTFRKYYCYFVMIYSIWLSQDSITP